MWNKNDHFLLNQRKICQLIVSYGIDQTVREKTGSTAKGLLRKMKDEYYDWLVGGQDSDQ